MQRGLLPSDQPEQQMGCCHQVGSHHLPPLPLHCHCADQLLRALQRLPLLLPSCLYTIQSQLHHVYAAIGMQLNCQMTTESAAGWTVITCLRPLASAGPRADVASCMLAECLYSVCCKTWLACNTAGFDKQRWSYVSKRRTCVSTTHWTCRVLHNALRQALVYPSQALLCVGLIPLAPLFHRHHGCSIPPQPELFPGSRHPLLEDRAPQSACAEPTHLCLHGKLACELIEK